MPNKLMARMEKNSMEEYRFSIQEYRGCKLLDIRVYFDSGSGEKIPTKKGVSVPVEKIDEFLRCLKKAHNRAIKEKAR